MMQCPAISVLYNVRNDVLLRMTRLVINSLGGGHTHINIQKFVDRSNYKKPGARLV